MVAPTAKTLHVEIKSVNQVIEVVKQLKYDALFKSDDVIHLSVTTTTPKVRVEIASMIAIIQFSCDLVKSNIVSDVSFNFSAVKLPFTWPQKKTIRDILFAKHDKPIAIELIDKDCRLIVFRKNDHNCRDNWYSQVEHWRKDMPNRFHLVLNELVENVSAHAKLEESRFCFTVGLYFANNKLYYSVADSGVGLRGSLREAIVTEAKDVAARACALNLTRPQFTSKGIERGHRGVGLFITSELSQMNQGYLEILSGQQEYEQRDTTVMRVRGMAEWKGTMVHGAINLGHNFNFNYREAMRSFKNPDKLHNDRFLVCNVFLNVYGQPNLRTRELCEEIIRDLELAAKRSPKIILDFTDIKEISQAFSGFLKQFVVKHSKVKLMIIPPPDASEDLSEDLEDLMELAAKNNVEDDEDCCECE